MVFSSHIFLFYFLPLALALYFIVGKKWRNAILTLSSYVFYGWGEPSFVLLLLLSTCIDWCCGLVLMDYPHISSEPLQRGGIRTRKQKMALWASVVSNLSLLGFFKYCDFGISNWNLIVQSLFPEHGDLLLPLLHISLPLGISFYTFQSMSYTIDVYRGDAKGITNIVDFACYVSLFPQLVAGPIVRFQEVANQMRERVISVEKFARGIAFFILGMAQKILLASTKQLKEQGYYRCLTTRHMRVVESDNAELAVGKEFILKEWSILGLENVNSRKQGDKVKLNVFPAEKHKELQNEYTVEGLSVFDLPMYYSSEINIHH